MGQLGRHDLEHQPERDHPAGQQVQPRRAALAPQPRGTDRDQRRPGPKRAPDQAQIEPGRAPVLLLPGGQLGAKVPSQGLGKERTVRDMPDRDQPGADKNSNQQQARHRIEPPERRALAPGNPEPGQAKQNGRRDDRPLQQDGRGDRQPEDQRCPAPALPQQQMRQRAQRRSRARGQGGIGLRDIPLHTQQERRDHHQTGQRGASRADQGSRGPDRQQRRQEGRDHRWQAIGPDRRLHAAEQRCRSRLQPIDARGLLPTRLVLKADVDQVPGLEHLLGGLGKACLVPVGHGHLRQARQQHHKPEDKDHKHRAPRPRRGPVQDRE